MCFCFFSYHISKYIGMCNNTICASKHGAGDGLACSIIFHLPLGSKILLSVVGNDSTHPVCQLCGCLSPSPLVDPVQLAWECDDVDR